MDSPWFRGSADLLTYELEELLATKLRALYQRSKGRDLYDLAAAVERFPKLDFAKTVECFERYLEHEGHRVSRAEFEANMAGKMSNPAFHGDLDPIVAVGPLRHVTTDLDAGYLCVHAAFITRLHGDAWKGAR